jgi:cephalosporin hydroxylase
MFFKNKTSNYTDKVSFDVKSIEIGHLTTKYKDVPLVKCPFDYLIYQMIVWEVKPDLIIEIGTNIGGSALYLSDLLDQLGNGGVLHTIDIENKVHPTALAKNNIKFYFDGFENYNIDGNYKNILIIDDGSHSYEHVIQSLEKFSNAVSLNSYFIVEDGILDNLGWKNQYNGGPNKAISEFIDKNNNFIIDRKWCDLYGTNATFNTNGYLKRIK